jgi:molybdenum cofactor sulfurtransferase
MDVYLDHAGAAIPPKDLLDAVFLDLYAAGGMIGNPHSSPESMSRIEEARLLVLHFFGIDSEEWDVVFTSGGTSSLRLVGELCPFGDSGHLLYSENMHTSALSLRCFARNVAVFPSYLINPRYDTKERSAAAMQSSDSDEDAKSHTANTDCREARLIEGKVYKNSLSDEVETEKMSQTSVDLLVTSGECNFSGQRSCLRATSEYVSARNNTFASKKDSSCLDEIEKNLKWIRGGPMSAACNARAETENCVQEDGFPSGPHSRNPNRRLLWLLDASKLASSSKLNLSHSALACPPDFVVVSFYKLFGYPTGLGALLVRRDSAALLRPQKRFFGGGTLAGAVATEDWYVVRDDAPHAWLEDGTPHFLGIASLRHGFAMLNRRGGLTAISERAAALCLRMAGSMLAFHHSNGARLVDMFGTHEKHVRSYELAQTLGERELIMAQ